jgi:tRNA(Ile)-lysidine synthase TilS/MesJ/rhodanese-related sulfurtransferase
MRTIAAAEFYGMIKSRDGSHSPGQPCVIDIRDEEEFRRGSLPGAENIPAGRFEEDYEGCCEKLRGRGPFWLLCHTGYGSRVLAERLCLSGLDAGVIEGGWRSCLLQQLERLTAEESPEDLTARRLRAEKSLIKKYRKEIWCRFTKAVRDYRLIQEGDRVACCISGGKDSFLLAKLLQELQMHGPVRFDLIFLTMNPGYNEENWKIIQNNAKILGIPLTVFETSVFDAVAGIEKNPCYLCARMRRGYLYNNARQLGCNKIALGHHYDDVIETILMGMLYAGKIETMLPKLHSQHFEGMELIRPLYLVRESAVKAWRDYNGLHFIQCACRFTESTASYGALKESKRGEVKKLIAALAEKEPVIEANIFRSVENINLRTVMAWKKDGESHSFLDDYDMQKQDRTS